MNTDKNEYYVTCKLCHKEIEFTKDDVYFDGSIYTRIGGIPLHNQRYYIKCPYCKCEVSVKNVK